MSFRQISDISGFCTCSHVKSDVLLFCCSMANGLRRIFIAETPTIGILNCLLITLDYRHYSLQRVAQEHCRLSDYLKCLAAFPGSRFSFVNSSLTLDIHVTGIDFDCKPPIFSVACHIIRVESLNQSSRFRFFFLFSYLFFPPLTHQP